MAEAMNITRDFDLNFEALSVSSPTGVRFPDPDLFNALSIVHPKLHRTLDSKDLPALVRQCCRMHMCIDAFALNQK